MQIEGASDLLVKVKRAPEEDLFRGLEVLTTDEHAVVLKVLVILGEIDERRAYAKRAYPSTFDLCVSSLKYSEGQACRRLRAARAIRKYPSLFKKLAAREITLTNLAAIQKHLTDENHNDLANAVGTHRTRDVERILATWFPEKEKKPLVRKLPDIPAHHPSTLPPPPPTAATPEPQSPRLGLSTKGPLASPPLLSPPLAAQLPAQPPPLRLSPPPPAQVKPESASRYRAHFTMTTETYDRLERIKELTKGCAEAADLDRLMARAIRLLEEDVNRRTRAAVKSEKTKANTETQTKADMKTNTETKTEPETNTIARTTKRAVFRRDGEQCTFRDDNGNRCPARAYLELDHILPKAKGGDSSEANLRVRCRTHNRLAADLEFGSAHIDQKIIERRSSAARARGARSNARFNSPPPTTAALLGPLLSHGDRSLRARALSVVLVLLGFSAGMTIASMRMSREENHAGHIIDIIGSISEVVAMATSRHI